MNFFKEIIKLVFIIINVLSKLFDKSIFFIIKMNRNDRKNPRESILIDLDMENICNYNLKKSFSTSTNDYLKIEDLNLDEKIFDIENQINHLRQKGKLFV